MADKIFVYRIQNKNNQGPYSIPYPVWTTRDHNRLPNPYNDKGIEECFQKQKQICGFHSLKQLLRWFNKKEILNLRRRGFHIYKIPVPKHKVIKGKKQVVFPISYKKSIKKEKVKIQEVLDLWDNKTKTVVYRIEYKDGNGPYRNKDYFCDDWASDPYYHDELPTPQDEGLNFQRKKHICGFESLEQLSKWFNKREMDKLKQMGFKIYKITVPKNKVRKGSCQVIFDKYYQEKKEVLKVNLSTLYKKERYSN